MHRRSAVLCCLLMGLAACTSGSPNSAHSDSPSTTPSGASGQSSHSASGSSSRSQSQQPPAHLTAASLLARMSEAERVGQLLMIDCPTTGVAAATVQAIQGDHVGSVILDGTSTAGAQAIRQLTSQLENDNPSAAQLFIATDQEGGQVQRLQGPGFSQLPSAVAQGHLQPATLRSDAKGWGRELRAAGVNVDLAPVLDTVPTGGGSNPPIGDLDREYGNDPGTVASHGVAFAEGLADAGVVATVKHFPGLGRVAGNTDTTAGVQDTVTTAHDPYLQPFARAVSAGVPFVMVSTAIYTRIDASAPAIFSHTIVTDILRRQLRFHGVVITDDVGNAAQVRSVPVGERAVRFIQAGGDMVLTVVASQASTMTQALLAKANADPAFRALVDAAALRVLTAKQRLGLLTG